jgi:hypothetical protein
MTIERPMFPPVDPTRRHLLTIAAGSATAALASPLNAASTLSAVPTAAPSMPSYPTDERLTAAANGLLATDEAIDQIHREHAATRDEGDADERADYQALLVKQDEHIATLITESATSAAGIQAKAAVLRFPPMMEWMKMHQQIAR